jgi:hypothetical protein
MGILGNEEGEGEEGEGGEFMGNDSLNSLDSIEDDDEELNANHTIIEEETDGRFISLL